MKHTVYACVCDLFFKMNEILTHTATWITLNQAQGQILYESTYMKFRNRSNQVVVKKGMEVTVSLPQNFSMEWKKSCGFR